VTSPTGSTITQRKRGALADCDGLIDRLSRQLETLVERGRETGLDVYEVEEILPLGQRVGMLRERRRRLEDELQALEGEWTA
jgi:hypothetical protein